MMNSNNNIQIYLSGSIDKKGYQSYPFWTKHEEIRLTNTFTNLGYNCNILNPNNSKYQRETNDIYKSELNFISGCTFILIELSKRRGIGVGVEMYHAKLLNIPIFSICPDNSYYKKGSWIHPFVKNLSTKIHVSIDEAINYLISDNILNELIDNQTKKL